MPLHLEQARGLPPSLQHADEKKRNPFPGKDAVRSAWLLEERKIVRGSWN